MSEINVEEAIRYACATGAFYEAARDMAPLIGKELNAAIVAENAELRANLAAAQERVARLERACKSARVVLRSHGFEGLSVELDSALHYNPSPQATTGKECLPGCRFTEPHLGLCLMPADWKPEPGPEGEVK